MMKPLSPRERQVLMLFAQSFANREVATALGISVETVNTYRAHLREKLGLKTRAAIFRYAFDAGMLTVDRLAKRVPGYGRRFSK